MKKTLTDVYGHPIGDNQNSLTAGVNGPILMQDYHLLNKLAHFDRERIPERVVHAKGAGAHGYFEVTHDVTKYTKAKFLNKVGKRTPIFARFSTVGGEKGSADTARDPRGFAVKFYTEDGNYDMVGNNTPVFFIRDPVKFPDFIHTQKKNPQTNLGDANMFWDFLSLSPESIHQVMILFSSRGTPYGFTHMNGYSGHTFKLVNEKGQSFWCKMHFKTDQKIKNIPAKEAVKLAGEDPDFATRDLFEFIESGKTASWSAYFQVMTFDEAARYKFDVFDMTKVWPHKDYPLIPFGKMNLNRNPKNYFAETEQSAFSPGNLVPGIEASPDKMLQGRIFSYNDTHRHRLGPNYSQIPINAPLKGKLNHYSRDGLMCVNGNGGDAPNYEPNSLNGPIEVPDAKETPMNVYGQIIRSPYVHPNNNFEQPAAFWVNVLNDQEKTFLVENIVGHLKNAKKEIQARQVGIFMKVDKAFGTRVAQGLGLSKI
eukprot:gene8253-77_t